MALRDRPRLRRRLIDRRPVRFELLYVGSQRGKTGSRHVSGTTSIHRYGGDPSQLVELFLPEGAGPHPVVVVVHGGYWRARYDRSLMTALCLDLARARARRLESRVPARRSGRRLARDVPRRRGRSRRARRRRRSARSRPRRGRRALGGRSARRVGRGEAEAPGRTLLVQTPRVRDRRRRLAGRRPRPPACGRAQPVRRADPSTSR